MNDSSSTWSLAQKRERHFYKTRAASHEGRNEVYAEFHAPFWKAILSQLTELSFHDDGFYVDVGCGPNPIVAFVEHGHRIGVDPLMSFYQENFLLPDEFQSFDGTIEELAPIQDGQADVIFSMNNIDHIQNLEQAIATVRRKLKDDGFLVISVNIVGNPIAKLLAKAIDIYRVVDPTHTYHFHSPQEVTSRLAQHFDHVRYECIERFSEEMQIRKNERDKQVKTLKGMIRRSLKFVKNDLILREKLYLFLFKPKPKSS